MELLTLYNKILLQKQTKFVCQNDDHKEDFCRLYTNIHLSSK